MTRIAIMTSGGDAPGMNATIRAVTRAALHEEYEVFVIFEGYKGLVEGKIQQICRNFVSEIINRGGTILRTSRLPSFKEEEVQIKAANILKDNKIDYLIVIGGEGSIAGAGALSKHGIKCICIPATIDNDINATDYAIGFDTALNTIVSSIDKIRDTSSSHQRCSIIEVMGRFSGDLALASGFASGAEQIITYERPFSDEDIIEKVRESKMSGKGHEIIIISERLKDVNELAKKVESASGMETRATILGHLQRGGAPSAFDRVLASRMGVAAIDAIVAKKTNGCICLINNKIDFVNISDALDIPRLVDLKLYKDAERLK